MQSRASSEEPSSSKTKFTKSRSVSRSGSFQSHSTIRLNSGSSKRSSARTKASTSLPPPIIKIAAEESPSDHTPNEQFVSEKYKIPPHRQLWSPPPLSGPISSLERSQSNLSIPQSQSTRRIVVPTPQSTPLSSPRSKRKSSPTSQISRGEQTSFDYEDDALSHWSGVTSKGRSWKGQSSASRSLSSASSISKSHSEDSEKEPLSLSEMSIAIRRWNWCTAKSSVTYEEASSRHRPHFAPPDPPRLVSRQSSSLHSTKVSISPVRKSQTRKPPNEPETQRRQKAASVSPLRSPIKTKSKYTSPVKQASQGIQSPSKSPPGWRKNGVKVTVKGESRELDWEKDLTSEMRKIYQHFRSFDQTPRLRRGAEFQDLLVPTKAKRDLIDRFSGGIGGSNVRRSSKAVAFDLTPPDQFDGKDLGIKVADEPSNAELERNYRRHMARFYTGSASSYKDINEAMFPEVPDIPDGARSPFLSESRNHQVWEWLNSDFCKSKLDFFLALFL